jgi:hypothetical protein
VRVVAGQPVRNKSVILVSAAVASRLRCARSRRSLRRPEFTRLYLRHQHSTATVWHPVAAEIIRRIYVFCIGLVTVVCAILDVQQQFVGTDGVSVVKTPRPPHIGYFRHVTISDCFLPVVVVVFVVSGNAIKFEAVRV